MASMRFSIRAKLQLIFGGAVALILSLLVIFVYIEAAPTVRSLVYAQATETAGRYAATIQGRVGEVLSTARTLAQIVEAGAGARPESRRATISSFLRSVLERNPDYASVWTAWEPGKVDGLDARFRDTDLGNDTGRFHQTWFRGGDDAIRLLVEKDGNIKESDNYNQPMKDNQDTVIGPYIYDYGDGRKVLETSLMVPLRDANLKTVGVLGIDTGQSIYQRVVSQIRPFATGFAALYAKGGLIGGHVTADLLGKNLSDESLAFSARDFEAYSRAISAGKETTLSLRRDGASWLVVVRPFRLGASYTSWTLVVFIPEAKAFASFDSMVRILVVAALAALLSVLVLVAIASRLISSPIKRASEALREISEGEGDLSLRLGVLTTDETADLALHFNSFIGKLELTVSRLKAVGSGGAQVGAELAANSTEASATAEELAATVRSLRGKVTTLDDSIRRVGESVEAISSRIDDVGAMVGRQGCAVEETAASSQAIIQSLGAMARMARERGELADALVLKARDGESVVGKVLVAVQEIGGFATRIAEMVGVINDVAERTNLLAMNAAIEAAHAGDRGKGFAVVATEIRKLAQMTGQNAARIGEQLRTVTNKIDDTAGGAQKAAGSIRAMTEGMGVAANSFREVLSGLDELTEEGKAVSFHLAVLVSSTEELRSASVDIDARSDTIREAVTTIERLSSENTSGFLEMEAGIHEMGASALSLSNLGLENSRNTAVMEEELGKFRIASALAARGCADMDEGGHP